MRPLRVLPVRILLLLVGLLLSVESAAASASEESVTFTLYDNGSSQNGVNVSLTAVEYAALSGGDADDEDAPPGEAFAVSMSSRIDVSKYQAVKPVLATRAFREDGELVRDFDQLRPAAGTDGDDGALRRVYLVAEGLEFVWPFVELGHQQTISAKVVPPTPAGPVVLESVGDSPRVFRVLNINSEEEANAIISTALNATGNGALKRSTVGSGKDAEGNDIAREDVGRTSYNSWDHSSPEAKLLITRSFQLTNIEENDGKRDGLQIVRYTPGQGYNTHPDYFSSTGADGNDFDFNPYSGGSNRFATVFLYLNDPEEGGCTVFPRAPAVGPAMDMPDDARDMFKKGTWEHRVNKECYTRLAVPPKLGTAALFYSTLPDGRIDPMSHHAACPLIQGTKWGANIWIWNGQRFGEIRTGEPRKVLMKNAADETVYISWEGRDNGLIQPGGSLQLSSFEYHRFKASFHSHKDERIADFTVQSEPENLQVWEIEQPRRHRRTSNEPDEASTQAPQKLRRHRHTAKEPVKVLKQAPKKVRRLRHTSKKPGEASDQVRQKARRHRHTSKDPDKASKVLVVRNGLDSTVDIRHGGELFLSIKPHENTNISSFQGHTFEAAIEDGVLSTYTVTKEAEQRWVVSGNFEVEEEL